jgi:ribosomal protein S21
LSEVVLREGESFESMLQRFRSAVNRSGVMREIRLRRFYRSKAEKDRLALQRAIRRQRRREAKLRRTMGL